MIRLLSILLSLAAGAQAQEAVQRFGPETAESRLLLRTTTDIAIFAPTVEAFLARNPGLGLTYEQWGSNDLYALTASDCTAGKTQADIVISSGVHQMVKLVNDNCAASWRSSQTLALPEDLRWRDEIWGVTREPAVMIYNRSLVPVEEVPLTRFDLLDLLRPQESRYAGQVATYDIEASGLGFLFAFIDAQEASTFGALMEAFARSGAVATCCSAEIIEGVIGGRYLLAYNVLGSYAQKIARDQPELGIVAPRDYTLMLSRAAILPGTQARPEAGAFLDFLLSGEGQITLAANDLMPLHNGGDADIEVAGGDSTQRLIGLTPALLIASDRATTQWFVTRWRAAFSHARPE